MVQQVAIGQLTNDGFSSGSIQNARGGKFGDAIVSQLHGRYFEQAINGNMFAVANQAAVTTTAALNTTFTGLAISNPTGSGVNAVLLGFTCTQFAAGAAASVGIMTGVGAAAGSLVPRNRIVGRPTGAVTGSDSATLSGTPVLEQTFGSVGSVATTGYGLQPGIVVDLGGSIILPPGTFAASYTTIVTTTALIFSFLWEEVPV